MNQQITHDVAIIGSGIAGATLGSILAKQGLRVVLFEAGAHPRFAIGESMILETSEMMRALADFYDIPEIAFFSSENFLSCAGSTHGVKRHFGYLHHTSGETAHDPNRTLQAVIPKEPHGHELHLYRQDTDYLMAMCAVKYGATLKQHTRVEDVSFSAEYATITTADDTYHVKYVVDAAGFRSPVAQTLGLRDFKTKTRSRAIFTHMINVQCHGADAAEASRYNLPFRMNEGTLHHVFEGGWLWIIPFNNHDRSTNPLVSVGLMLDPDKYPQDDAVSAEDEFFTFIQRFPTVAAQFAEAKSVRDWVRAPRVQYRSTQVVGDRWALLGHAAGFIDPLYSKGLYVSLTSVAMLAHKLLEARDTNDYSRTAFESVEKVTQNFLDANDRLVANSYKSFGNYRLWQVYSTLWLLGAYTEYLMLNSIRARSNGDRATYTRFICELRMVGGGFDEFRTVADQIDALLEGVDSADEAAVDQFFAQSRTVFESIDWMPEVFLKLLDGHTFLPRRKLRLSLLKPGEGFMGRGAYRRHFFGEHRMIDMIRVFVQEKIRYATRTIDRQRRQEMPLDSTT